MHSGALLLQRQGRPAELGDVVPVHQHGDAFHPQQVLGLGAVAVQPTGDGQRLAAMAGGGQALALGQHERLGEQHPQPLEIHHPLGAGRRAASAARASAMAAPSSARATQVRRPWWRVGLGPIGVPVRRGRAPLHRQLATLAHLAGAGLHPGRPPTAAGRAPRPPPPSRRSRSSACAATSSSSVPVPPPPPPPLAAAVRAARRPACASARAPCGGIHQAGCTWASQPSGRASHSMPTSSTSSAVATLPSVATERLVRPPPRRAPAPAPPRAASGT